MITHVQLDHVQFEVAKLSLGPDDYVVFSTETTLTRDQANQIVARLQETLGRSRKVLVLTAGVKLSALTRAEIESMAQ